MNGGNHEGHRHPRYDRVPTSTDERIDGECCKALQARADSVLDRWLEGAASGDPMLDAMAYSVARRKLNV